MSRRAQSPLSPHPPLTITNSPTHQLANSPTHQLTNSLEVSERIDVGRLRIDGLDHRMRMFAPPVTLPRIGEHRLLEHPAVRVHDDLHLRPERIGRVLGGDDRELARVEAYQIADRKQPHEVDETLEQRLVERRIALLAHDAPDAHGGETLPVRTVAAKGVEH